MFNNIDFTLLMTQGYVVVPNFLNDIEKHSMIDGYNKSLSDDKLSTSNEYYVTASNFKFLTDKLTLLCENIREQTDLKVYCQEDFMNVIFFDNKRRILSWHQDHGSWYFWQQGYNLLNIWVPVIKKSEKYYGVKVLPWDSLDNIEIEKSILGELKNTGARLFNTTENNETKVNDGHLGKKFKLPLNINHLSVVPEVKEGDALIMRGDLIHATDDNQEEHRVAFSIRCTDDDGIMSKAAYIDNRPSDKIQIIGANSNIFDKVDVLFEHYDEVTIKDAIKFWKDNGLL